MTFWILCDVEGGRLRVLWPVCRLGDGEESGVLVLIMSELHSIYQHASLLTEGVFHDRRSLSLPAAFPTTLLASGYNAAG